MPAAFALLSLLLLVGGLDVGVHCGNHRANTCAACVEGHGFHWCNGECVWFNDNCTGPFNTEQKVIMAHVAVNNEKMQKAIAVFDEKTQKAIVGFKVENVDILGRVLGNDKKTQTAIVAINAETVEIVDRFAASDVKTENAIAGLNAEMVEFVCRVNVNDMKTQKAIAAFNAEKLDIVGHVDANDEKTQKAIGAFDAVQQEVLKKVLDLATAMDTRREVDEKWVASMTVICLLFGLFTAAPTYFRTSMRSLMQAELRQILDDIVSERVDPKLVAVGPEPDPSNSVLEESVVPSLTTLAMTLTQRLEVVDAHVAHINRVTEELQELISDANKRLILAHGDFKDQQVRPWSLLGNCDAALGGFPGHEHLGAGVVTAAVCLSGFGTVGSDSSQWTESTKFSTSSSSPLLAAPLTTSVFSATAAVSGAAGAAAPASHEGVTAVLASECPYATQDEPLGNSSVDMLDSIYLVGLSGEHNVGDHTDDCSDCQSSKGSFHMVHKQSKDGLAHGVEDEEPEGLLVDATASGGWVAAEGFQEGTRVQSASSGASAVA